MERGGGRPPDREDSGTGERSVPEPGTGERPARESGTGERRYEEPGTGARRWADLSTEEWQQRWEQLPAEERERRWQEVSEDRRERQQRAVRRGRRHRDLPAKVRRRQAIAVLAIAGLVIFGVWKLVGGGGGGGGETGAPETPLRKLVGQTVIGKIAPSGPSKELLKRVRKGQVGGVIVGAISETQLMSFTRRLRKAAAAGNNPPLLIMIDQEGGPVKRVPGPPDVSPAQLGKRGDPNASKAQGQQTGAFLKKAGVNVNLAPVADVSHTATPKTLSTRTFGSDPATVGKLSTAFAEGLEGEGVAATVKHFPGLGYVDTNPDFGRATVGAAPPQLQADIVPFKDAIDAGAAPLIMIATAIYPNLGSQQPAIFSQQIINDELRDKLGFQGVTMTDDLEGASASGGSSPEQAAQRSLVAGVDMVLFATTNGASKSAFKFLVKRAKQGKIPRDTLETAYARILKVKDKYSQ